MNNKEKITQLIAEEKEVLDFLKSLSDKEKKEITATVKKLVIEYSKMKKLPELNEYGYESYGSIGTRKQKVELRIAGYFCLNMKDYRKHFYFFYNDFFEGKTPYIFRPTWFSDFINKWESSIDYSYILEYLNNRWINPTNVLVANSLVNYICKYDVHQKEDYYRPIDNFDKKTLEEHIWLLFSEETNIHNTYSRLVIDGKSIDDVWTYTFLDLLKKEKISREKVIRESLLTSTRNFNRSHTGWFFKLLDKLKLSKNEMIFFQKELFLVLNGPQTKPINQILKYLKQISKEVEFEHEKFIEIVPILLSSDVKAVLTNTLAVLTEIAKNKPNLQEEIALLVVQMLYSNDEKIQEKASKFIVKFSSKSDVLKEEISMYYNDLFASSKSLLKDYAENIEKEIEEEFEVEKVVRIREDNQIKDYNTFDELVFFFSQAFENNEVYHFDLFVALLPKLAKELNSKNINKLEPAFQRAIKTTNKSSQSIGQVEQYMAQAFIQFIASFFDKLSDGTIKMKKLFDKINKEDDEQSKERKYYFKRIEKLDEIYVGAKEYSSNHYSKIFINQLQNSLDFTIKNIDLPILATPTHSPCWLKFDSFIERLKDFSDNNKTPNLFDFQIAISRLVFHKTKQEIEIINTNLKNEFNDILIYLIDEKNVLDLTKIKLVSHWFIAIYRKGNKNELEQFLKKFDKENNCNFLIEKENWDVINRTKKSTRWDYKKKKDIPHIYDQTNLVFYNYYEGKYLDKKTTINSFIHSIEKNDYVLSKDEEKLLYLLPFKPEHYLYISAFRNLKWTEWTEAEGDRTAMLLAIAISEIWDNFDEKAYLFFAFSLLYLQKPTRQMTAEVWLQAVYQDKINPIYLGKALGKIEINGHAPLKRFTDLIISQMLNISKTHNKNLEIIIENIILNMGKIPIKGTKKLLSIYLELLILNKSKTKESTLKKLEEWKTISSLKSVLSKIVKF